MHRTAATVAAYWSGYWHRVTLTWTGRLALADTDVTIALPDPTTILWTTAAALTAAMAVRGTACDPNVTEAATLPLILDPDAGVAYVCGMNADGTPDGIARNGIPHACGIGLVSLVERAPTLRSYPATGKAALLAAFHVEA
jgi:hypothetical protein